MKNKGLLFLISLLLLPLVAEAEGFTVFGVRTDFPMTDGQASFRDIYVSIGSSQGVKEGSLLDAYRNVTTVDEINQRTGRNISFKIARLKVIHAESDMAVARIVKMLPADSIPTGTYTNVMVGDRVDVATK